MIRLNVPDMSCGHCAGVITRALKALDPGAGISFDMPQHVVEVTTGAAPDAVLAALAQAGFPASAATS